MAVSSVQSPRVPDVKLTRPATTLKKTVDKAYKAPTSEPPKPVRKTETKAPAQSKPEAAAQQRQGIETYAQLVKKAHSERNRTRFDLLL